MAADDRIALQTHVEWLSAELAESLGVGEDSDQLAIPGLETILSFIALKLLVPAMASMLGRLAYDRLKSVTTAREAKEALDELSSVSPAAYRFGLKEPIHEGEVLEDLTAVAVAEGVSEADAVRISTALFHRVRHLFDERD